MSLLEEPIPKPHMPETHIDECYYFALSIVPLLSRLRSDNRNDAKINILKTLQNLWQTQENQHQGMQTFYNPPQHTPPDQTTTPNPRKEYQETQHQHSTL